MEEDIVGVEDILVVDDNGGDIRFIEEAFQASARDPNIHPTTTSDEALDFLSRRGEYEGAPDPDVILLDWNLSETTGKEVLQAAKSGDTPIPVIVMSGSKAKIDELQTTASKADLFIEKPTEPDGYIEAVQSTLTE